MKDELRRLREQDESKDFENVSFWFMRRYYLLLVVATEAVFVKRSRRESFWIDYLKITKSKFRLDPDQAAVPECWLAPDVKRWLIKEGLFSWVYTRKLDG